MKIPLTCSPDINTVKNKHRKQFRLNIFMFLTTTSYSVIRKFPFGCVLIGYDRVEAL